MPSVIHSGVLGSLALSLTDGCMSKDIREPAGVSYFTGLPLSFQTGGVRSGLVELDLTCRAEDRNQQRRDALLFGREV